MLWRSVKVSKQLTKHVDVEGKILINSLYRYGVGHQGFRSFFFLAKVIGSSKPLNFALFFSVASLKSVQVL